MRDHPDIDTCERIGYPATPVFPICPVCGEPCDNILRDIYGAYVGCDVCVEKIDAWEVPDCFPDKEEK